MAAEDYEITGEELQRPKALRRAAADIHASSVMRGTRSVGFSLSARAGGGTSVERRAHDPERFRSFMTALRRTYAETELANFRSALNVVSRRVEALRARPKAFRDGYQGTLRSEQICLNGLGHEEVFNAWLYGSVFHDDDPHIRTQWGALTSNPLLSGMANTVVEATALALAEHVLALDEIVADVLSEACRPKTH